MAARRNTQSGISKDPDCEAYLAYPQSKRADQP
ncbi:hypothetical protein RLEG12_11220 (plasmid) [Rhizobium leguminosarum bv. trifolii CB782]|nr:hypothetical protein RLEG12_11220 [Rhizobium leguminosarum bv. trifolii CB782]